MKRSAIITAKMVVQTSHPISAVDINALVIRVPKSAIRIKLVMTMARPVRIVVSDKGRFIDLLLKYSILNLAIRAVGRAS